MESLDPNIWQIPAEQICKLIEQYIPLDLCRNYQLVPLAKDEASSVVVVGMTDPNNLEALDLVNWKLRSQKLKIQPMVIAPEDCQQLLQRYLHENAQRHLQQRVLSIDLMDDLDAITGFEELDDEREPDLGMVRQRAETAPAIAIVNKIIVKALQENVSDIHIEPQAEHLRIRFRKDGVLSQAFPLLPRKVIPAVITRLKIIANLDIAERRCPQNGRVQRLFEGRKFDLRVSTLPNRFGEKIAIRLQERATNPLKLEQLIQNAQTRASVKTWLQSNIGLIIVSSHPNAGGKHMLYAMLAECNAEEQSVCSLENPIEYDVPGVSQIQILREPGMDYASYLNALLTQDTDIIFADDIPDQATANVLLDAARRGLIVAGLPIDRSEQAIEELRLRGIENWKIARSVLGIVNQTLLRCVCPDCREIDSPKPEELEQFGVTQLFVSNAVVYAAKKLTLAERLTKTNICLNCGGTGYQGQIAVHEVMLFDQTLQRLVTEGRSTDEIRTAAIQAGMKTGLSQGLDLFAQGITTLHELERVFKVAKTSEH